MKSGNLLFDIIDTELHSGVIFMIHSPPHRRPHTNNCRNTILAFVVMSQNRTI